MSKFIFLKSLPTILEPLKRLIDRKAQDVDWNENDPASSSYIANRTHYKSTKHVVDLPETSIEFTNNSGLYMGFYVADIPLSEGDTKIVVWDGVSYKCVATPLEGVLALGNAGFFGGENTGEPFLIGVVSGNPVVMITSDTSATHTVGISGESTVIHKIPEEYLPPMDYVSYVDYQDLTSAQMRIARENIGAGTSSFNGNYNSLTNKPTFATVATSGSYNDLTNKPTLATVATSGNYNDLTNKPTFATVATSGSYNDLEDKLNIDSTLTLSGSAADAKAVGDAINNVQGAKNEIAFIDQVNGYVYCVAMRNGSLVSRSAIKYMEIVTAPTKTEYMAGECFDPTGMVVMGTDYDGVTKELSEFICSTEYLSEGAKSVEVRYIEAGITHTALVSITVNAFDPETALEDFAYTDNGNGTYTITDWNGTLNGESSNEMIIPNNGKIII